jgi:hypothetical protein
MPRFSRSELTGSLIRFLSQHDKGDRVGYEELSRIAGIKIHSTQANLIYARRILEQDHNAVWGCIQPHIGLLRLNDAQIADRQRSWFLKGARNKLSRGAREAEVVEIAELDIDRQARFATDSIIRELARDALSKATQQRISKVARGSSNDLPSFNAVEWMISLSPRRSGAKNA